jgi:hypothetical protein
MRAILIGFLGLLALVSVSKAQDDGKKYCQQLIQCYEDAQKLAADCQNQNANRKSNSTSTANNCKAAVQEKTKQLKPLELKHRQIIADCVKDRLNEAMPVNAKQSARCQGDSTPAPRNKRQADQTGSSANVTASTGGAGGKGKGGKGKGHGGGKGKGNGCQKQVHEKQQQCKRMQACCSEVQYCHLKFELSDLHDQIRKAQLDILEQRRQCQKQQASNGKGNGGSNNVQMDDPLEDEEEDEDFMMHDH